MTIGATSACWWDWFIINDGSGNPIYRELATLVVVVANSSSSLSGCSQQFTLLRGRFDGEVRVGVNKRLKASVVLGVGDLPGKPPENHTQENDGDTPNVCFPGIIVFLVEDLWSKIWGAADDTSSWCMCLAGIVEDGGGTKINELNDIG